MRRADALRPEWDRIDLLGLFLSAARQGSNVSSELTRRLGNVQSDVRRLRALPPWQPLTGACGLSPMDQDILACAVAPSAQPRLGWMYQDLQPGTASAYPTPALIRELLAVDTDEGRAFHGRLAPVAPLIRAGLIEMPSDDIFQPIRPTRKTFEALLGWSVDTTLSIPGARLVETAATWDDLVLPLRCISDIKAFMLWVTRRDEVTAWGANPAGGPVALFSGPSGTGKTLAAEVVANGFGSPLYRVDLGLLVSKYIGETEKNLNALFDAAEGRNIVLLFDEADSLFAKRGEVKDARDRYANMEVSHLLSRIERHRGPCILTSNLRHHLDPAFARRFQMVVTFPRPNEQARTALWALHIPKRAPGRDHIDVSRLGKEMHLTGGQIRNAALHASFLASGAGEALSLRHIASAVWTELAKSGEEMNRERLGNIAHQLPKEEYDAAD